MAPPVAAAAPSPGCQAPPRAAGSAPGVELGRRAAAAMWPRSPLAKRRDRRHDLGGPPPGEVALRGGGPAPVGRAGRVALEPAELGAARPGGGERCLGAGRDHLSLVLGDHRHDPDHQAVRLGQVAGDELDPGIAQRQQKGGVAGPGGRVWRSPAWPGRAGRPPGRGQAVAGHCACPLSTSVNVGHGWGGRRGRRRLRPAAPPGRARRPPCSSVLTR